MKTSDFKCALVFGGLCLLTAFTALSELFVLTFYRDLTFKHVPADTPCPLATFPEHHPWIQLKHQLFSLWHKRFQMTIGLDETRWSSIELSCPATRRGAATFWYHGHGLGYTTASSFWFPWRTQPDVLVHDCHHDPRYRLVGTDVYNASNKEQKLFTLDSSVLGDDVVKIMVTDVRSGQEVAMIRQTRYQAELNILAEQWNLDAFDKQLDPLLVLAIMSREALATQEKERHSSIWFTPRQGVDGCNAVMHLTWWSLLVGFLLTVAFATCLAHDFITGLFAEPVPVHPLFNKGRP